MARIDDYRPIVGDQTIDELYLLGERLKNITIQNVNSTPFGGGVAEILSRMIPLMKDLGVDVWWDVIKGDDHFFQITKKIHNALHGIELSLTREELSYFLEVNQENAKSIKKWADIVFVHDPQPIYLVKEKRRLKNKWIWRCHIDFSNPKRDVWLFLKKFIEKYDVSVFSAPAFARKLSIRQVLIYPSIDPLKKKNYLYTKKEATLS